MGGEAMSYNSLKVVRGNTAMTGEGHEFHFRPDASVNWMWVCRKNSFGPSGRDDEASS